jgi:glucuronoarabinoxylan endo-1,4-beta-xylanase
MRIVTTLLLLFLLGTLISNGQTPRVDLVTVDTKTTHQTITGFGASLAYYEGWLTAHPNKAQIYNAIFKELSLDILRVRNAYGYDATMINRVKEFNTAARNSLGKPIDILVTSWGPPAALKSNKDKSNGGTLRYTVQNGKVNFDYAAFAKWWNESLDNYNANGIFPTYISIQNEPDYKATWESCLLRPSEVINATDTIAGYNKALNAVYDTVSKRTIVPKFLGPETIGIGYNAVENYVNALDIKKLHGIAHHLYHGVDENNPYASTDFAKVGNFRKEVPHYQTEYSRGDWLSMIGMVYKSLNDENVVAYLYWDLIWDNNGLVSLDFPWDQSRWKNPGGFEKTKMFYAFKQYSAYIHPGWKRVTISSPSVMVKNLAFINPGRDSLTVVSINTSATTSFNVRLAIPGLKISDSRIFRTSMTENEFKVEQNPDSALAIPPRSITTVSMKMTEISSSLLPQENSPEEPAILRNFPNPFNTTTTVEFPLKESGTVRLDIFDFQGRMVRTESLGSFSRGINQASIQRRQLLPGIYLYRLGTPGGNTLTGRFTVTGQVN